MTLDELEALCARLERELAESEGTGWMAYEWRARQRARIAETRTAIAALTTPTKAS